MAGRRLAPALPRPQVRPRPALREHLGERLQSFRQPEAGWVLFSPGASRKLKAVPPELAADIMEGGIVVTGGGALLRGLDVRIANETGTPVITADRPLQSVVIGSGRCLEEFDLLQDVLSSSGPV